MPHVDMTNFIGAYTPKSVSYLVATDGSLLLFQGIQRDQETDDAANAAEIGQSDYVSPPLGTNFPRELHTRLQSAHAGWTGNRLFTVTVYKLDETQQ